MIDFLNFAKSRDTLRSQQISRHDVADIDGCSCSLEQEIKVVDQSQVASLTHTAKHILDPVRRCEGVGRIKSFAV